MFFTKPIKNKFAQECFPVGLLFLVFFICGCTAKYDLDIKENSFTENLEISATSNETLYKYYINVRAEMILSPK